MTGLKDFIYQYKDKVSDYIDEAQEFINVFTDMADNVPDIIDMTAGDVVNLSSDSFAYLKNIVSTKIINMQLMIPDTSGGQPSSVICSGLIFNSAIATDNFKIVRLVDPDDQGSEQIDVLYTSTNTISGGYDVHFIGWDNSMPNFSDIFENVANSYACQDIISQVLELLDQGTLNCNTLTSMFSSKYDKFSADAKLLYNNILAAVTVAGPGNMLSTVWQVIRETFSGWENATVYDGTILFNNNDYSVDTSMCLPWSTIAKGATAILSTVTSIISPILGAVIAGVSAVGSAVVDALEFNESNEFMLYPDSQRDNDCYAVPISTYIARLEDDDVYIPIHILKYLSKYGKVKIVNGLYTIYAWIGDNIPFSNTIPFSSVCFEVYFSMLSGSEYTLSDTNSFIANVENAFNINVSSVEYGVARDVTTTISLNNNLSISNLKTNFDVGFGTKDNLSSFNPSMGNAPEITDQDANSRNRTIIRRLLMNTILYLYTLASVHSDYPITETISGVTHTLFNYTFTETIPLKEFSVFDPYSSDYTYEYAKTLVPNPIDLFNRIISEFIYECRDINQQHFTFLGMPSASVNSPWSSDAAVIAGVINNWILPAINDLFKYIISKASIQNRNYFGLYFITAGVFPEYSLSYQNSPMFLNGCTNDYLTIPGISNSANPYCIPPKHTVNLWVRVALATFAVVAVTVAALVVKSRVKRAIARKAYMKSMKVKEAGEAFKKDMSTENFNKYYRAQKLYNLWWGKLSGLYYDGVNDWYNSSYDLAGGSVMSSVVQWVRDKMSDDTALLNNNVNTKTGTTNSKVDTVNGKVTDTALLVLEVRRLINGDQ